MKSEAFNYNDREVASDVSKDQASSAQAPAQGEGDLRSQIGFLGRKLSANGVISVESKDFYDKIATGKEDSEVRVDMKMLQDVFKHANQLNQKSGMVLQKLNDAIQKGEACQRDKEFWLKNIIQHPDFINKFEVVGPKFARMKKRLEVFSELSRSPLNESGVIKVGKNSEVKVPNLKEFSAMTAPERKNVILNIMRPALEKAEKYFKGMDGDYKKELGNYRSYGKIGKQTEREFSDEFETLKTVGEKEHYLKELPNQIARYEALWDGIRKDFKDPELKELEDMRDTHGFNAMQAEIVKMPGKIDERYQKELDKYVDNGVITPETKRHFLEDADGIRNVKVEKKYDYIKELPNQLKGHIELKGKIDQFSKEEQALFKKHTEWSHSRRMEEYDRLTGKSESSSGTGQNVVSLDEAREKFKAQVGNNTAVIDGVGTMVKKLKESGQSDAVGTFSRMMKRLLNRSPDAFDTESLRKKRATSAQAEELRPEQEEKPDAKVFEMHERFRRNRDTAQAEQKKETNVASEEAKVIPIRQNKISEMDMDQELEKMEKTASVKVKNIRGYHRIETEQGESETVASIDREAIKYLLMQENDKQLDEKDAIVLMYDKGKTMSHAQAKATQEYLEAMEKEKKVT